MSKFWLGVIAAVVIVAGVVLAITGGSGNGEQSGDTAQTGIERSDQLMQEEREDQPAAENQTQTTEVSYTENGFEPNGVTIKAGDTITWTNRSGSGMWVASDDHPVHNDYPGFDQLGAGNSYSFTFERGGTWGYHNHLDHSQRGTVIVNE